MRKDGGDEQIIAALLASCKELKAALAAAMCVIAMPRQPLDLVDDFVVQLKEIGVKDGVGVRAELAITKAEAR